MKTKISITVSLVSILFVFTQCVKQTEINKVSFDPVDVVDPHGGDPVTDGVDGGSITGEFSEQGATEVAKSVTSVGIKDFEQIYRSMAAVTGINPADERDIRDAYEDLSSQLPNDNSIKTFSSSTQFAIFKLGSEFCDTMVDNGTYRNAAFPTANMGAGLNNASSKGQLVDDLMNRFWGVGVQDAQLVADTRMELLSLVDELQSGETLNATTTRNVAKGVCSSLLITPPITMI